MIQSHQHRKIRGESPVQSSVNPDDRPHLLGREVQGTANFENGVRLTTPRLGGNVQVQKQTRDGPPPTDRTIDTTDTVRRHITNVLHEKADRNLRRLPVDETALHVSMMLFFYSFTDTSSRGATCCCRANPLLIVIICRRSVSRKQMGHESKHPKPPCSSHQVFI
jgi:hypothetical protein